MYTMDSSEPFEYNGNDDSIDEFIDLSPKTYSSSEHLTKIRKVSVLQLKNFVNSEINNKISSNLQRLNTVPGPNELLNGKLNALLKSKSFNLSQNQLWRLSLPCSLSSKYLLKKSTLNRIEETDFTSNINHRNSYTNDFSSLARHLKCTSTYVSEFDLLKEEQSENEISPKSKNTSNSVNSSNNSSNSSSNSNKFEAQKKEITKWTKKITEKKIFESPKLMSFITSANHLKNMFINFPFSEEVSFFKKRVLIIDLDRTIIYSEKVNKNSHCSSTSDSSNSCSTNKKNIVNAGYDFSIHQNSTKSYNIYLRPYLKEFLQKLKHQFFFVVFSHKKTDFVQSVVSQIDPKNELFIFRLSRNHCVKLKINCKKYLVKDLRIFRNLNLDDLIMIGSSIKHSLFQIFNFIPILPFVPFNKSEINSNAFDNELLYLSDFLLNISKEPNLRNKIKEYIYINQGLIKNSQ